MAAVIGVLLSSAVVTSDVIDCPKVTLTCWGVLRLYVIPSTVIVDGSVTVDVLPTDPEAIKFSGP